MFCEELSSFFNPDEFGTVVVIQGILVNGILESSILTLEQVQCCQVKFTCAHSAISISNVKLGDEIKMADQSYQILTIKPDGSGLIHLLLEKIL